jgi:cytochrome c-type biogenesis protein CcmF
MGIVCETTWNSEYIGTMKPKDTVPLAGYEFTLEGLQQRQGPNYQELAAVFSVSTEGEALSAMTPSKRSFATRGMSTTEAALQTRGVSQLYISLGDTTAGGGIVVRIYHKPLVLLIWFGPVLMALGGLLSLSDRRLRVGVPKPAKALRGLQAAE